MSEVCAPHFKECPKDNNTALQVFGKPFIEIYETCGIADAWYADKALWIGGCCAALLMTFTILGMKCIMGSAAAPSVEDGAGSPYHALCNDKKVARSISEASTSSGMTGAPSMRSIFSLLSRGSLAPKGSDTLDDDLSEPCSPLSP
jgi:hypothetical protein